MKKKLFYSLSDNADINGLIMSLEDCLYWIQEDMYGVDENLSNEVEYTLIPVWMTQEEFDNLPEASI